MIVSKDYRLGPTAVSFRLLVKLLSVQTEIQLSSFGRDILDFHALYPSGRLAIRLRNCSTYRTVVRRRDF